MDYLIILLTFIQILLIEGIIVKIPNGDILGATSLTITKKQPHYAFKSVRFAEPPDRFEAPVPVKRWSGIYNATRDLVTCYKFIPSQNYPMSEDCLYLSIYTPQLQTKENSTKLAVMVWISGGFYIIGTNLHETYAPDHLLDENVIVVTINYRLGAFGFLSTGDGLIPGNNGVKDVLMGIKWVHENIIYFGGDPKNVTLFGQSAGASIISYLSISKATKNKGYFQRTILQSGSALHPFALQRNPGESYVFLKISTGCIIYQFQGEQAVKDCLKRKSPELINLLSIPSEAIFSILQLNILNGLPFAPVMENPSPNAVITLETYNTLNNPKVKPFDDIKVFMGTNSEEGALFDKLILILRALTIQADFNNNLIVPVDMYVEEDKKWHVGNEIKNKYFQNRPVVLSPDENIIRFISEIIFNKPMREYLRLTQSNVPTYCYIFSYPGKMGGLSVSQKYPNIDNVGHFAEIFYLFDSFLQSNTFDPHDLEVRQRMIKMWTNFAKWGNPTPVEDPLLQNIQVPRLEGKVTECVNINSSLSIIENFRQDGYDFWSSLYRTYGHPKDTY